MWSFQVTDHCHGLYLDVPLKALHDQRQNLREVINYESSVSSSRLEIRFVGKKLVSRAGPGSPLHFPGFSLDLSASCV